MVARIVEYVHAGDAFQVVPSQRWSADLDVDAFSVYRGLRVVNPSPYMYFLDFLDFQVAGASPEPLLTVTGDHVSTRPIAGTRPRGADAAEDALIAEGLLADEKERAEHVMLVDLGRNDLGRVCQYGSVQVDTFMAVETYSHVMHIVSSVSGTLRRGVGAMDALRSVLPAGTLSGAPKVRAMQIIDELEPVKRGGYGGDGGRQGRRRARAGRGRHGGRRAARLRVPRVRGQGPRGARRGGAGHGAARLAVSAR
jgi:anthranilate synthase component 1